MKQFFIILLLFSITASAQEKLDVTPKLYGFARGWYQIDSSFKQGSFIMKEVRIGVRGNVTENISYKILADFARFGGTTSSTKKIDYRDTSGRAKTETIVSSAGGGLTDILLDAEAVFAPDKTLSFSFGQYVIPFGFENQKGNADIDFANRTLLFSNVTPDLRDIGLSASYSPAMSVPLFVKGGIFNGTGQNKSENDRTANYSFMAGVRPISELGITGSYYGGRFSTNKVSIFAFSIDAKVADFSVAGEFAQRKTDSLTYSLSRSGFYVSAFYDYIMTGSMITHIIPGLRYESLEPNADVSSDKTSKFSFGLSVQFAKINYARFRVNYEIYDYENSAKDSQNKLVLETLIRF